MGRDRGSRSLTAVVSLALIFATSAAAYAQSPFGRPGRKRSSDASSGWGKKPARRPSRFGRAPKESSKKPPGTRSAVAKALSALASRQQGNGSWRVGLASVTGTVVGTSFAGLALMASGSTPSSGPYSSHISKAVRFVQQHLFDPPRVRSRKWDQTNWQVCIGALFLAEAYARTRSADLKATLDRALVEIFRRMESSGGWGHSNQGPNALGYVELEVMSTWALGAAGALKHLGFRVPPDKVTAALTFIRNCCAGESGGVGYSPRRGQKGIGEEGRTGGAIWLFGLHGQKSDPLYGRMAAWWRAHLDGAVNGHGSIAMGCLGSALGGLQLGGGDWDRFVEAVFPKILNLQNPDGTFRAAKGTGAGAVGGDRTAGTDYNTALYTLTLQLDLGNLRFLGRSF